MTVEDHDTHWTWRAPGVEAACTGRDAGNIGAHVGDEPAAVLASRTRAAALLGLDAAHVAGVTQVHGADVWLDLARTPELPEDVRWDRGASSIEADALVTTRRDVALAVGIADCVPIAVAWGEAIAAIHAGWRSLEQGIVEATFAVLHRAAGSSAALADAGPFALVGPCLGACCMEVGEDVAARFDETSIVRRDGAPRPFLDTRADATRRLEAAGCNVDHVAVCTKDDPRCFSHRGDDGRSGRQALLVRRRGSIG